MLNGTSQLLGYTVFNFQTILPFLCVACFQIVLTLKVFHIFLRTQRRCGMAVVTGATGPCNNRPTVMFRQIKVINFEIYRIIKLLLQQQWVYIYIYTGGPAQTANNMPTYHFQSFQGFLPLFGIAFLILYRSAYPARTPLFGFGLQWSPISSFCCPWLFGFPLRMHLH